MLCRLRLFAGGEYGRRAACADASDQLNLLIVTGSLKMKGHNDRIRGFSAYLREKKVPYKLVDVFEALDNDEYAYQMALGP